MKEDKIKKIYNSYFGNDWIQCYDKKEIDYVLKEYNASKVAPEGYKVIIPDFGETLIYKEPTKDKSVDEIKALIQVEQAQNIRSIKKYISFFVVLTVITMIVSLIYILVVFTG